MSIRELPNPAESVGLQLAMIEDIAVGLSALDLDGLTQASQGALAALPRLLAVGKAVAQPIIPPPPAAATALPDAPLGPPVSIAVAPVPEVSQSLQTRQLSPGWVVAAAQPHIAAPPAISPVQSVLPGEVGDMKAPVRPPMTYAAFAPINVANMSTTNADRWAPSPVSEHVNGERFKTERPDPITLVRPVAPVTAVAAWQPSPALVRGEPIPNQVPSPASGPTGRSEPLHGDVFLDGARVGRWISEHLAREAGRPAAGGTGFDPRMGLAWPGGLQGN